MRSQPFLSTVVGSPLGDLIAISLPAGEASAIIIDNPSGSWLTVYPIHDFVPPYTLQWSRDFPSRIANATVRYTDGPSGQVSTLQGDPIRVWLDTDPVGPNAGIQTPGVAFIEGFTPVLVAHDSGLVPVSAGVILTALIPITVGKRARMLSWAVQYTAFSVPIVPGTTPNVSDIRFQIQDNEVPPRFINGVITPENPSSVVSFQPGIDFGVGRRVDMSAETDFADQMVSVDIVYNLI